MAGWIDGLIGRMLEERVWGDWRTQGWGRCPLRPYNLMWKGHLNLMYALHLFVSGEATHADAFRRLSADIAGEMRRTPYGGALCQSINYYFQCNTVGMLSLRYHDAFYGTSYTSEIQPRWLAWARDNMLITPGSREKHNEFARTSQARSSGAPDLSIWPESAVGCYEAVYHPESTEMGRQLSGYTNGWIATYLNVFDPPAARALYLESFKPTFVREFGEYAFAEEQPGKGLDGMATLFALYAAREHGDRDLMGKILNLLDCATVITYTSVNPELSGSGPVTIDFPSNVPMQGAFLFGKTNIGIARLLEKAPRRSDPGPEARSRVPDDWRRICPEAEGP